METNLVGKKCTYNKTMRKMEIAGIAVIDRFDWTFLLMDPTDGELVVARAIEVTVET